MLRAPQPRLQAHLVRVELLEGERLAARPEELHAGLLLARRVRLLGVQRLGGVAVHDDGLLP